MNDYQRHLRWYHFLRPVVRGPFFRLFGFTGEVLEPGVSPFLLIANHNCDLDPGMIGVSCPEHLYFLASEHVYRRGFASKLLKRYFAPIAWVKGATDASAALSMIRWIKKGVSCCLFAEGNRSFNGVTGDVMPATGKLAKATGAALITYRLEGGYLTTPRWAYTRRVGKMLGYCVNVYTPEQLKQMTAEEVNQAIARDIYEDAFARQREEPVRFRGKRLAEGLERALYMCPRCHGIDTMHGKDDRFTCSCGYSVKYNEYGFFEGDDPAFETVLDWDRWQTDQIREIVQKADETVLFSDENKTLSQIDAGRKGHAVAAGTLSISGKALTLGARVFLLEELSDMSLYGAANIMFTDRAGEHFEIRNHPTGCGRKYVTFYEEWKKTR